MIAAAVMATHAAVAQEETAPPPEPAVEAESPPPAEATPSEAAPAEVTQEESVTPPAGEEPPPDIDPESPRRLRRSYERETSGNVAGEDFAPAPPGTGTAERPYIRLKLKDGREVEGGLVSETSEGYALQMPTGETRFFDRLDVVSESTKTGPTLLQKLLLGFSLAWPGVGQLVYGFTVQQGGFFTRSAIIVGAVLILVALASASVMVTGAALGVALPRNILGGSPLNAVTAGGAAGLALAFLVALLDAGARILFD